MPDRALPNVEYAKDIDAQLSEPDHIAALRPLMSGWSRSLRWALGLAAVDLAKRLGISQPAVTKHDAARRAHRKLPRLA